MVASSTIDVPVLAPATVDLAEYDTLHAGGGGMTAPVEKSPLAALVILLRALDLPTVARHAEEVA
jgi:hypothetical protein